MAVFPAIAVASIAAFSSMAVFSAIAAASMAVFSAIAAASMAVFSAMAVASMAAFSVADGTVGCGEGELLPPHAAAMVRARTPRMSKSIKWARIDCMAASFIENLLPG
jgi:hypothetical protein